MDLKVLQNILNSSIDKARKIWLSQMKSLNEMSIMKHACSMKSYTELMILSGRLHSGWDFIANIFKIQFQQRLFFISIGRDLWLVHF